VGVFFFFFFFDWELGNIISYLIYCAVQKL